MPLLLALSLLVLCSCGKGKLEIVSKSNRGYSCGYTVIFGEGEGAVDFAKELSLELLPGMYDIPMDYKSDASADEGEYEIIINSAKRAASADFAARIEAKYPKSTYHAWGYKVSGSSLILYFSDTEYASLQLSELISSLLERDGFSLKKNAEVIRSKSIAQREAEDELKDTVTELGDMEARYRAARKKNDALTAPLSGDYLSRFGGNITESLSETAGISYPAPPITPSKDARPKVNITKAELDNIRKAQDTAPTSDILTELKVLADSSFDGCFGGNIGTDEGLGIIEAKALYYLISGKRAYGYEAIVSIKNAILTADAPTYAECARLITVAAETYDWCYWLMSKKDRTQLIAGVEMLGKNTEKMPIGFPPTQLSGFDYDGACTSMMCAYLSFSAAIYADFPDWWSFTAGRFYAELLPSVSLYLKEDILARGTHRYREQALYPYLEICRLITSLGGAVPYDDAIGGICPSIISHIMPSDSRLFGEASARQDSTLYSTAMLSASLFNDKTSLYYARVIAGKGGKEYLLNKSYPACSVTSLASTAHMTAHEPKIPLAVRSDGPFGLLTLKSSNDPEAVWLSVNIGTHGSGGYDDSGIGTFEIYYKGALTENTELNELKNSDCRKYYGESTVSKNGLLIFDPDMYASAELDGSGSVINKSEAYYTGSQLTGYGKHADPISFAYGYKDGARELKYAYVAIDNSDGYDPASVNLAERRMLALYTDGDDIPMVLLIFDRVFAAKSDITTKFLLQAKDQPSAGPDGNSVTLSEDGGALVLTSFTAGSSINTIKNPDGALALMGESEIPYSGTDAPWGRIEVSAGGDDEITQLNSIYVKNASSEKSLDQAYIHSEHLEGVKFGSNIALFVNDSLQYESVLEFESSGEGELDYYISGIKGGNWSISVNGEILLRSILANEAGLIHFSAPAGKITLTPTE